MPWKIRKKQYPGGGTRSRRLKRPKIPKPKKLPRLPPIPPILGPGDPRLYRVWVEKPKRESIAGRIRRIAIELKFI